ncbi:hypothetical protein Syun_005405 [Stephania yunnanensis]|uniref:Uncharacterized protein n=1 Tax=Stephania yunnanensis TaxID=152371 RepID=A0AAP0L4Q6_9MAGN
MVPMPTRHIRYHTPNTHTLFAYGAHHHLFLSLQHHHHLLLQPRHGRFRRGRRPSPSSPLTLCQILQHRLIPRRINIVLRIPHVKLQDLRPIQEPVPTPQRPQPDEIAANSQFLIIFLLSNSTLIGFNGAKFNLISIAAIFIVSIVILLIVVDIVVPSIELDPQEIFRFRTIGRGRRGSVLLITSCLRQQSEDLEELVAERSVSGSVLCGWEAVIGRWRGSWSCCVGHGFNESVLAFVADDVYIIGLRLDRDSLVALVAPVL